MSRVLRLNEATATNGAAAATLTGFPAAQGGQLFVDGFILSASGAPAAAVVATLTGCDAGEIDINIPANAFAPIVVMFPNKTLRVTSGDNAVLTLPALGAGVVGTATLFGSVGSA